MGERSSYYHWRAGFKPNHLELGSLVLDFKNPRGRGCFTSSSWRDTKDTPKDTVDESPKSDITLVHKTDSGWGVGGGIQNFASLSFLHAAGEYTVVTWEQGRKEELKEPEKYFSDILLQADSAKFWLAVRLSVFRKLEYLHKKAIRPTIWMVTGPTPRKASTEASHSSGTGVVLPPPSPSASAILSAGASGPPNPFARPPPPSQQNSQTYSSNNNMDTPMSALPSRFVADGLLPSPSSFYPEWNFGGRSAGRYIVENATVRSFTQSASSTSLETTSPLFSTGATELAVLDVESDAVKNPIEKGKSKPLLAAYAKAAENNNIEHFKAMLAEHQKALEADLEEREERAAKKATKKSRKSVDAAALADDADDMDIDEEVPAEKPESKKRKKAEDSEDVEEKPAKTET